MIFRISKWHSLDFVIKLNSYITILNQGLNMIIFTITYLTALCKIIFTFLPLHFSLKKLTFFQDLGIDVFERGKTNSDFEKLHRRFICYGLGSVTIYFLVKSMANI